MGIADIFSKLLQLKPTLNKKYGVRDLGVFGSHVRGEAVEGSDIDILIDFPPDMDLFKMIDLKEYLEDELGSMVDLVNKNRLKKQMKERILKEVRYV